MYSSFHRYKKYKNRPRNAGVTIENVKWVFFLSTLYNKPWYPRHYSIHSLHQHAVAVCTISLRNVTILTSKKSPNCRSLVASWRTYRRRPWLETVATYTAVPSWVVVDVGLLWWHVPLMRLASQSSYSPCQNHVLRIRCCRVGQFLSNLAFRLPYSLPINGCCWIWISVCYSLYFFYIY